MRIDSFIQFISISYIIIQIHIIFAADTDSRKTHRRGSSSSRRGNTRTTQRPRTTQGSKYIIDIFISYICKL